MAQLIVRSLEPEVVAALKQRAARRGRSAEAEHRDILRQALGRARRRKSLKLKQLLLEMPPFGADQAFARRKPRPRRAAR